MLRLMAYALVVMIGVCLALIGSACVVGSWLSTPQIVFRGRNSDRTDHILYIADVERRLNVPIILSLNNAFALSPTGVFALLGEGTSLVTVDLYGNHQQILTQDGEYNLDYLEAEWSPDGTMLAFVNGASSMSSNEQIYLYHQNTVRNLMPDDAFESIFRIVWSPDGTHLAFLGYPRVNLSSGIYTLEVNTVELTRVSPPIMSADSPTWSPDGSTLAFSGRENDQSDIYVIDIGSAEVRNLTNSTSNENFPAWSPYGTQIAFTANYVGNFEIYVISADGNNLLRLTDNRRTESHPVWSADGRYIMFTGQRPTDGGLEIHVMRADGSERRLVSYDEIAWSDEAVWLP
jgi:Tol biopolymer transport system component